MLNPHEVSERIRILEEAFVSQAERIRELTSQNQDLRLALGAIATGDGYYGSQALEYKQIARSALAAIAEQNAGAESRGSGGRAAGEPAGGDSDAGVAPPPAAPDQSADVGKTADERLSGDNLHEKIADVLAYEFYDADLPELSGDERSDCDRIADRILALLPQPPARICLVCGASEPCMTEADLKPGDPGVPCTFDPTPQELAAKLHDRMRRIVELERQLETDPTMPEKPSEAVLMVTAGGYPGGGLVARAFYYAIRDALKKEQGR